MNVYRLTREDHEKFYLKGLSRDDVVRRCEKVFKFEPILIEILVVKTRRTEWQSL